MTNDRRNLGDRGEALAARYLEERGLRVLERGDRTPFGELDLVVKEGDTVAFVEAKTRSSSLFGLPQEAVTRKRLHMTKAALSFLHARGISQTPIRFDVVAIRGTEVEHIRDAFSAEGFTR